VRFCPAPSGVLHVGSVRAALYNWLHARQHDGTFVFRIEDTDATRATDESMRSMIDALAWIGLDWDEGPDPADPVGTERGGYGPYRQSQRTDLYAAVARRLEQAGHLYRDFRTTEELEAWRETARRGQGGPPVVKAAEFRHSDAEVASSTARGRPSSTTSSAVRWPSTGRRSRTRCWCAPTVRRPTRSPTPSTTSHRASP
jgi:glutamyl-tRNA synthetase